MVVVDRGGVEMEPSLVWGRADGMDDNNRFGQNLALSLGVRLPLKPEALGGYSLYDSKMMFF